jgi:hypothetical protein
MVCDGINHFNNINLAYSKEMIKMNAKRKYTIWLLIFIFSLPMFIAYQLAQHPDWVGKANTTNYGDWVKPGVMWKPKALNNRDWQLVYWDNGICDKDCFNTLNQLAKIRLAMGRKLYQMNIWLMIPNEEVLSSKEIKSLHKQDIQLAYADKVTQEEWKLFASHPIVLFSPEKQALLMYESNPNSKKMYHDLQLLIK